MSYYDGGGRLWAVDLRHGDNGIARSTPLYYTYEEYRLDALGRRVLVRARKSCQNHPLENEVCPMLSSVRRTVWAGDRELYEIQMPDDHGENDTAEPPTQPRIDGFDPNPFWGRVAYTYGGAIDQPLSIVRVGYKDYYNSTTGTQAWPEFAIIPHWNAHGQAQTGTFHDGTADFCRGGYTDWCVKLQWADGLFPYKPGPPVPEHWHGTLVGQKRDASGLMYRRNRYYDPVSGRFTQEDPIGLAGGVNVYGFANGDPVSYSDPYGLCIWLWLRRCREVSSRLTKGDVYQAAGNLLTLDINALAATAQAQRLGSRGVQERRSRFGSGQLGADRANAWRHIFGACYLTATTSVQEAREITRGHESRVRDSDPAQSKDSRLDHTNNEIGMSAASDPQYRGQTCQQRADDKIADGHYAGLGGVHGSDGYGNDP